MIKNRELVYQIRKNMPENQTLHDLLAKKKINQYKSLLIPESYVLKGEEDPSIIPDIIHEFEKKRPEQIAELNKKFDEYITRADIKLSEDVYEENRIQMLFNCLAYGFAPDEYIFYKLQDRTIEEKKKYITDLDRKMMQYIMNDFKDLMYLFDKSATYEKFGKYYKREVISITSKSDFEKFMKFTERHDEIVIKQVADSCGHGISIEKSDTDHLEQQFENILSRGKCSIEEKIIQSNSMGCFNKSSVNTVRVRAFNTKSGIKIGPCTLITGRAGAIVNNGGSGGIMSAVNRETGIVETDGFDEYLHRYKAHPTSGITFVGYQLPEWDSLLEIVNEMGAEVPKLGYIGWDLAHTDNGWVLVEGNGGSQFVSAQICYDHGCRDEIEKYIADRNIY